ncbi:transglutaminase-like domain-containing protein [Saccharothrix sp. BKS2]|uniref:transglutaminase-like domain-containing protein n=1 Tax=Saccharothrix sp. BKS2 TaxID=3064400 RepID=UPI0039E9147A
MAIEQVVKQGRAPDAQAPVGSSYARLERFLFGAPGEPGAGAGTAEQFASAFAVLGRAVGLPTRVVVGFQPGAGEERAVLGGTPPPGPRCTSRGGAGCRSTRSPGCRREGRARRRSARSSTGSPRSRRARPAPRSPPRRW